jgi:large repetitive protein
MSVRYQRARRQTRVGLGHIEMLEGRALLSITADSFSENALKNTALTIELSPFVEDSDPAAILNFSLVSPTTSDGASVSVNATSGVVTYTPGSNSSSPDSFHYFVSDSDGDTSATETVTLNLSSVAASPVAVSEVEGQSTIGLAIINVPGAVQDTATKPTYTFSNAQVVISGTGTVSLTDTKSGTFTYTPPSSSFTGEVLISYEVSDGTGASSSSIQLDIEPIAADPVTWGTLSSTDATVPSTTVPSLLNRIHDVAASPSFTFSDPTFPAGDGSISALNSTTGAFTYTAPNAAFTGEVPVQYTVSDGANSTIGNVSIVVEPLVTQPVTVTELDHQNSVSLTILNLIDAVQDVNPSASYSFTDLRVIDGGGSVPAAGFDDPATGAFTYELPATGTPRPVHIGYTVSDGTNTANGTVTIQLVAIVANSANFSVLESTPSTLPALDGRVVDVKSDPTLTFSSPSVPTGDGTVAFTDTTQGILSYTPPAPNFTGTFPVQYTVSDGTNSTRGVLNLTVAPLITSPLLIPVALQTQPTNVPSIVASGNIQDVASDPSYTFSNAIVGPGDGSVAITDATTGALTYTPPFASFFGLVQITYSVTDGTHTTMGTVDVDVEETMQPKDDGPIVAVAGKPLTILAVDLLANDAAAPNGLKLSIGSVGNATDGTVVLNANGSVTFTPTAKGTATFTYTDTDADSDASTVATVTLDVKLGPDVRWATPAAIIYGTPLGSAQLNATANVPGTFQYGPVAGTILNAGSGQTLVVEFTPTDTTDYANAVVKVQVNVLQATPIVYWSSPGTIVKGAPLSTAQLDATANVPGTFSYIPGTGTVLGTGNGQTLTTIFTPFDLVDYTAGYDTTTINVQPATPPGLTVKTRSFSGRVKHNLGGAIATLHTTLSKLKTTYYTALINWDDGVVQRGKLAKSGTHGFKVNATHKYRMAGTYDATVIISDPHGDSLTENFVVSVR